MSNPIPLELQSKIAAWRLKAADGTLTLDEMKEAIVHLRAGRLSAAVAASAVKKVSATGAKKTIISNSDDLLDEI
jgi:rhodanese-related sulfurtransferase